MRTVLSTKQNSPFQKIENLGQYKQVKFVTFEKAVASQYIFQALEETVPSKMSTQLHLIITLLKGM